jgi:hypothetical protein
VKRFAILLILLLLLAASAFAQLNTVVKAVTGKVEVKAPLMGWEPATVGMVVPQGSLISTGFKSTAQLEMGSSEVFVKQLTRMSVEELVMKEGTQATGLNLRVGRVSAQVKSTADLKHDFKLRSPVSTAAVRGTEFEYDGWRLTVDEGEVVLIDPLGRERLVIQGEEGFTKGYDLVTGANAKDEVFVVETTVSAGAPPEEYTGPEGTGGLVIKW